MARASLNTQKVSFLEGVGDLATAAGFPWVEFGAKGASASSRYSKLYACVRELVAGSFWVSYHTPPVVLK